MAIDYEKLLNFDIPGLEQSYTEDDSIFYALSVGLGLDPVDEGQLAFVYEKGLKALPTLPIVMTYPGSWISRPETGIDYLKVVHGEHSLELHQPPAAAGRLAGKTRVVDIVDKGEGRGALIVSELQQKDAETGAPVATVRQTTFARGNGGFGGPSRPTAAPHPIPDRAPDIVCDLPTSPQTALLYRLNADRNPLHADPDTARRAGFPRPILHGLATFGVVGHALLRSVCGYDPALFGKLSVRFTAPVFPGETIRTEIWRDGPVCSVQARVVERDVVVIGNGRFETRQ